MKLRDLIKRLEELDEVYGGDLEVLIEYPYEGTEEAPEPRVYTAGKNEYPKDWNMPEGFTFVQFRCGGF